MRALARSWPRLTARGHRRRVTTTSNVRAGMSKTSLVATSLSTSLDGSGRRRRPEIHARGSERSTRRCRPTSGQSWTFWCSAAPLVRTSPNASVSVAKRSQNGRRRSHASCARRQSRRASFSPAEPKRRGHQSRRFASGSVTTGLLQRYWISLMMLNIGRYRAITMPPTHTPITTISNGSISEVRASTVASTSAS